MLGYGCTSILANFSLPGKGPLIALVTEQERDSTVRFPSYRARISHTSSRRFRENLRHARSYGEWKAAAADLDQHLSNDIWCEEDAFAYYDHSLIRRVLKNLKTLREGGNSEELKAALEACIKSNFGTFYCSISYLVISRDRKPAALQSDLFWHKTTA